MVKSKVKDKEEARPEIREYKEISQEQYFRSTGVMDRKG